MFEIITAFLQILKAFHKYDKGAPSIKRKPASCVFTEGFDEIRKGTAEKQKDGMSISIPSTEKL